MRFAAGNFDLYFESVLSTVYFESAHFPGILGVPWPLNNQVEFTKKIANYKVLLSAAQPNDRNTTCNAARGCQEMWDRKGKKGFAAELET